jgi:uncharacterized protein YggE
VFIDFITQNRVYDFTISGTQATEQLTGFETKKTVAIRYKSRELFERIVSAAVDSRIFDLIKVDYIVSDFDSVRAALFEAAAKVLKSKEQKYANALGISLGAVGLSVEKYDVTYPSEAYQRYQAYETGDATVENESGTSSRLERRKSFTFFYEPFQASSFDSVVAPSGIEPTVQYSIYLRMQYQVKRMN